MKFILTFSFTLLIAFFGASQADSTALPTQNQLDSILRNAPKISVLDIQPWSDCAHGHVCCYSGCSCCPDLKRAQVYDTVEIKQTNGVRRALVTERYGIAREHDIQPTHIRFKVNGKWSEKYYPVHMQHSATYTEMLSSQTKEEIKKQKAFEKDHMLMSNLQGEYLILDLEGKEVPMTFHTITALTSDLSVGSVVINDLVFLALVLPDGTAISRTKYTLIDPFNEDGLAVVHSLQGLGLIDKHGIEIIPAKNSDVRRIGVNAYNVEIRNGNHQIFDGQGRQITKAEYSSIGNYSEGLAFAHTKDNEFCFLDLSGKVALKIKQEWAYDFKDGLAAVVKNGKWGFIDKTGKLVIDYNYYRAHNFSDGAAPVATGEMNNEAWILIDKTGKPLTSKTYSEIMEFKGGIAQVRINGVGYGFIDTKGKEVMECTYTDFGYGSGDHWDINGLFVRSTIKEKKVLPASMEIVDLQGNQLAMLDEYVAYRLAMKNSYPANGYYPFIQVYKQDNSCNLLDLKGQKIFNKDYDNIQIYSAEIAVGTIKDQYFILNPKSGEVITDFGSKQIINIQFGIVTVVTDVNSYEYEFYDLNKVLLK